MLMAGTSFGHIGIFSRKFRNQFVSSAARSKAMNSAFIVDLVMQVYLEDFQDTTAPPISKMYPLVDFVILESEIQFAFEKLSSIAGYLI